MGDVRRSLDEGLLEAILFAADEPVRPADVAAAFGLDPQAVVQALQAPRP